MEWHEVGPVRLWGHEWGDVCEDGIYILRGLKVAVERVWDAATGSYVNNTQGLKKLDYDARTAIENVTDKKEVASRWGGTREGHYGRSGGCGSTTANACV